VLVVTNGFGGGTDDILLDIDLPRAGQGGVGLVDGSSLNASARASTSIGVGLDVRLVRGAVTGEAGALLNGSGKGRVCPEPSISHRVGSETADVLPSGFREISCSLPTGEGFGRRGAADCARRCVGRPGLELWPGRLLCV